MRALGLLAGTLSLAGTPCADDVQLDFPETVELKAVVDYVAATLQLNILYDETQLAKKVSLHVAGPVPRDALLGLLRSVLRSRGLALVSGEQPGWWKIVTADQLALEAGPPQRELPPPGEADAAALTYVFTLCYAEPQAVQTALAPYLSKPGGAVLPVPDSRLLVISDFAANVRRAVEIAALLDTAPAAAALETIAVAHQDPAELAELVQQVLADRTKLERPVAAAAPLTLRPDPVSGDLIALGTPAQIARARELVARFDQPIRRTTRLYQPRYVGAIRLRGLIEELLPGAGAKIVADEAGNALVVTARPEVHERVAELVQRFDAAPPESATPLRFYKLLNRRADDAFATIGMLLMGEANGGLVQRPAGAEPPATPEPVRTGGGDRATEAPLLLQLPPPVPTAREPAGPMPRAAPAGIQGKDFSLSLDEHTNTILAIATPEKHRQIEMLIKELDKRRPQVLVEVTLVSVSAEDSLNLGVELQTQDLGQPWDFELFTLFGLSTINPTTGQRRLIPSVGGTGVLLAPDEVPIIVHALATSGKTRIYSAPRILVDDNATGTIESVAESPYASVNASVSVATTSFAGFAKAGTQLTIEPHIAQGDHLELKYNLTVSSFTGTGTAGVPPPRSADTINSTIRVPDGHTVIVGGLLTETLADSSSHVPYIGEVPILGLLFGTNTQSKSKVRLYAFIKPTILRHDEFEDLKHFSEIDRAAANVPDDYPPDRWQTME